MPSPVQSAPRRIATVSVRLARQDGILRRIASSRVLDADEGTAGRTRKAAGAAPPDGRTAALGLARRFRLELVGIETPGLPEEARTSRDVMIYELESRMRELAHPGPGDGSGRRSYADLVREQTTTDLSPAEICGIGVGEVAAIERRLAGMARAAGFPDLAAYRAALNADPGNIPRSAGQIVADVERYVDIARPNLARLVRDPPATPLVVEPMPAGSLPNITHHVDGSAADGSSGRILVAVSDPSSRTMLADEAMAFHEGLPGHELQVSMEQRLSGLPAFRKNLRYSAYGEGWAVYAEGLGADLGIPETPSSAFGRVNLDLTRALRLVADTGMHARGWSRERVAAYLRASGAEDEPTIEAEADRIAAWPAQGLAYKIGQLKFLELRGRARRALGAAFDLREFHGVLLRGGSMPLPVLERRVDRWIAGRRVDRVGQEAGGGSVREQDGRRRARPVPARGGACSV